MASINNVILVGNLGADPELRFTAAGRAVCNLRLATNRRWKDKEGLWQEDTQWHRVVAWGATAERCGKVLRKGRLLMVVGRIQTRTYEDRMGTRRTSTEVISENVTFLDRISEAVPSEGTVNNTTRKLDRACNYRPDRNRRSGALLN